LGGGSDMKYGWLMIIMLALIIVSGCSENEAEEAGEEPVEEIASDERDPGPEEYEAKPCADPKAVSIELTEYISEDGKVTVKIDSFLVDDIIPDQVNNFFATDKGAEDGTGIYFESSELKLFEGEVYYLAFFMTIKSIEDGFEKIAHASSDQQPLLITEEGLEHERTITKFKYTGEVADYAAPRVLPAGSEGVIVFACPAGERPSEVHYIYSLAGNEIPEAVKGKIILPLNTLTNN